MATAELMVGVVLERRRAISPWAEHLWLPAAVLPGAPDMPAGTPLGMTETGERFFAGNHALALHRTDTSTYRDNLATSAPRVWVALRTSGDGAMPVVAGVTCDPAEGESYTEAGDDIVEHVAMVPELAALLAGFVAEHHVERAFVKRRRRDWAGSEADDTA